jgi:dipeptidyl aminopeptidase/acylaminoacyl peptidase
VRARCGGALTVLAAVILAIGAALPPAGYATFPGQNGKIAFHTNRDGNFAIYVMDADGSDPTRLTNNDVPELRARWSSDGTKIAFMSLRDGNNEIYVMNANGSNQTWLTNNPAIDDGPTWGPPLDDDDNDGVLDEDDRCPDTPAAEVVNENGGSINQLCPCDAQWKNHLQYVLCVTRSTVHFVKQGLITKEAAALVLEAVRSACGK